MQSRPPKHRLFLESRYRKLSRALPQTIFHCPECKGYRYRKRTCQLCAGYGKLTKDSVEELLARRLLPAYRARRGKFHGAGREDVDVLMLGRGRPFVFEVVEPRRLDVDLDGLLDGFHRAEGDRLRCAPFRMVPRRRVAELKESRFDKLYGARVELDGAPPAELDRLVGCRLPIRQRTPHRVAHRRADLERERSVTILSIEPSGERCVELRVLCSHGCYVKEWISGDDGRTAPSLSELLGITARCQELDVLEVLAGAEQEVRPDLPSAGGNIG